MFGTTKIQKEKVENMGEDQRHRIAETRKLCEQIVVMTPYRPSDGINVRLAEYWITWANAGIAIMPMRDQFGGFIDIFRAHMCKEFLRQQGRRYLVFLDNDVVPMDPEGIVRLCGHDLPVVSGVACALRPQVGTFACVAVKDKTGVARFPTTMDTKVMPAYGTREIESCGAGIVAIRRDVLESMKEEPFLLPQDLRIEACNIGSLRKSEDIYFSEQVKRAGFDMHVDFSVQAFHDKNVPLHWPREQLDENLDADAWDVTSRGLAVEMK